LPKDFARQGCWEARTFANQSSWSLTRASRGSRELPEAHKSSWRLTRGPIIMAEYLITKRNGDLAVMKNVHHKSQFTSHEMHKNKKKSLIYL
jgi:hypothetical protein